MTIDSIRHLENFHAHVYFDASTRAKAVHLREEVGRLFAVGLGRVHSDPVGPHPKGMFQIAFPPSVFPALVPWLMLNRNELDVLVHPETGNDLADHTQHAAWLGNRLMLNLEALHS